MSATVRSRTIHREGGGEGRQGEGEGREKEGGEGKGREGKEGSGRNLLLCHALWISL